MKRKILTYEQFIAYRNKMIIRRDARRRSFPKDPDSYYDIRIREINQLYPEYAHFGQIQLKETHG